jgi:hypothetical protein
MNRVASRRINQVIRIELRDHLYTTFKNTLLPLLEKVLNLYGLMNQQDILNSLVICGMSLENHLKTPKSLCH